MPTRNHATSQTNEQSQSRILPDGRQFTPEEFERALGAAPSMPIIDDIDDSDDDGWTCEYCDEWQDDDYDRYHIRRDDGREEVWCQSCYENDSFHCDVCGSDFSDDQDNHGLTNGCVACDRCYDEECSSCDHCEGLSPNGHLERIVIDVPAYRAAMQAGVDPDNYTGQFCRECVNNHCFISAYSGITVLCRTASEKVALINHSGLFVHRSEINQSHFRPALNGVELLTPVHPSVRRDSSHANQSFIPSSQRRSRDGLLIRLRDKAVNELSSRPSSYAPPVHDKVYIGIEIEAQAGKFVVDQPLRVLNQALDCPYKDCSDRKKHNQCSHGVRIVRDGSIRGEGWEFLPPIIKHRKGWEQIENLVNTLKDFGWGADSSCGIHFHLSHGLLNPDHPEIIRNVFRMFYWLEPLIFNCLPIERRNNKYCYPISKYFSEEDIKKELKLDFWYYGNFWKKQITRSDGNRREQHYRFNERGEAVEAIPFGHGPYKKANIEQDKREHYYVGRYIGCNLHPLFSKGTIEFRYFPTYLDYNYIKNWAEIISRMVKACIEGIDVSVIEQLSASRGNMDTAIKDMARIFKFPSSLANFMKLEYRKYRKNPEFVPTPKVQHIALRDIHSNFVELERSIQRGFRRTFNMDAVYSLNAQVQGNDNLRVTVNEDSHEYSPRQFYVLKHLTHRVTRNTDEILRDLIVPNREILARFDLSSLDVEIWMALKAHGGAPSMSMALEAMLTDSDADLRNLQFNRPETPAYTQNYDAPVISVRQGYYHHES